MGPGINKWSQNQHFTFIFYHFIPVFVKTILILNPSKQTYKNVLYITFKGDAI